MQIHQGGQPVQPLVRTQNVRGNDAKSSSHANASTSEPSSIDTASTESLVAALEGKLHVRESLVAEIQLKIETGEYLTEKAAVETADAILNL